MLPKIESPTFEVELPSNKEKVSMRTMKVKEEKILLMAKESTNPLDILSAIKQVVNNCLVTEINIDDVALFDLEYLFLKLRAQSVSDIAEVSYLDNEEMAEELQKTTTSQVVATPEYEEEVEKARKKATRTFKIDLNKVEVVFPKNTERTIQFDKNSGIILKYPPAYLYGDKEFVNSNPEDVLDMLISKSIETIYAGDKTYEPSIEKPEEMKEWLDNLDVKVHNKILEFFTNLPHLEYELKWTNSLGKERTVTLNTLNDFFQFA